jgi:hypothetical protein
MTIIPDIAMLPNRKVVIPPMTQFGAYVKNAPASKIVRLPY